MIFTSIACLAVYFLVVAGISFMEWAWRIETGKSKISDSVIDFFPLSFSVIQYKWLQFTGPFCVPVLGVGSFFLNGFIHTEELLTNAILLTFQALWFEILLFTIAIVAIQHLFGRRIGLFHFLFGDLAISESHLYFRPYLTWHSIPRANISIVKQRRSRFLISFGTTLRIAGDSPLPDWYHRYVFGNRRRWHILIWNMHPRAHELVQQIKTESQNR